MNCFTFILSLNFSSKLITFFRLEKMKKEYRNLSTWKEKVDYLQSVLSPELEHKNSEVINTTHSPTFSFQ